jgi:hypothetical protein
LEPFGILSLNDVNIVCDRGSNFVCAFKIFDPIFCYGHRSNNVVKISFFQNTKKKKKVNAGNIIEDGGAQSSVVVKDTHGINTDNDLSSDESESSSEDECDIETAYPVVQRKNFTTSSRSEPAFPAEKMTVDQIPACAKRVLVTLNQCKKIVKYVKKVKKKDQCLLRNRFM